MGQESNERKLESISNWIGMKTKSYQNLGNAALAIFRGIYVVQKFLY